jgi:hypothetical protein
MYSAFVGAKAPGLDGMRCALVLLSNAALEGFSGLQVSRAPVRPLCHLIVRQQTWQKIINSVVAGRHVYTELKALCVWVKDNGGMGSLYRSQHELVLVFTPVTVMV